MVKKIFKSVDGNTAVSLISYNFIEVAGIYPITPSSTMAENIDIYASLNKKNFFNNTVKVVEMQSEGGAAGVVHGALQAGVFASTYTASQGLLLMIPNIYKWVGEFLPVVIHVSARSLATRSLSIFGDHQDIYAIRQTGIVMLCSHSVQEVADLTAIAHLIAIDAEIPVCHFFDGFRTSHEIQNVEFVDDNEWKKLIPFEKVAKFRARALNPHTHPVTRGGAENDDIYFQGREAQNKHFNNIIAVAEKYFDYASKLTGRNYAPFTYYGSKKAKYLIIAMGSVTECIKEVIDELNDENIGLIKVHLYRPFSAENLKKVLPITTEKIAVLDRTKEPGASGEPLYLDVVASLSQIKYNNIEVFGGRYGLSSKDIQPKHIKSVYDFLKNKPWHSFTVGINDDVTNLSIPIDDNFFIKNNDYISCLFYGFGSDGTVSANKSSIKIISEVTHQYAQAYFQYDSRKSGGVTRSHIRFGKKPIRSTYYVQNADFISCSLDAYIFKFDIIKNLNDNGVFLLNTNMNSKDLIKSMPNNMKYLLAKKNINMYIIDANKIAETLGMGRHTNTVLQSSFFYLNQNIMPYIEAQKWMKKYAEKSYAKKGEEVVQMNLKAIDEGTKGLQKIEINSEWLNLNPIKVIKRCGDDYFDNYVDVISSLNGDTIPTSEFTKFELLDGTMRNNITYYEQRSTADKVPFWNAKDCLQCNNCVILCPHATIRSFLLNKKEVDEAPDDIKNILVDAIGNKDFKYCLQVSPKNCVGCGLCVAECLGNKNGKNALKMVDAKSQFDKEKNATYLYKQIEYKNIFSLNTVKGVGFLMPYMEVSGACAGCGETQYYELLSRLFGKDLLIANATGCSSIYNGSTPLTPFCTDKNGEGIAWANSLFEDNAEFGYGMRIATDYKLKQITDILTINKNKCEDSLIEKIDEYLNNIKNREKIRLIVKELIKLIKISKCEEIKEILNYERDLIDKTIWIIGGDGWSYDIGYGGLDHILASKEDVNILILDTEVYSNTGGQASKSTQIGAIAKFASSGKTNMKKDLAKLAMTYGNVYVAQITMSNTTKAIQTLIEAENYHDGPSLIICYAPCINHGIKGGMINSIDVERKALECGYFINFRFNPKNNILTIDSKKPDFSKFKEFVMRENRFSQLFKINSILAEEFLKINQNNAIKKYQELEKINNNL